MAAIVSIKNLRKSYVRDQQRIDVLHALDLDVEEGEFLAIMGQVFVDKGELVDSPKGVAA